METECDKTYRSSHSLIPKKSKIGFFMGSNADWLIFQEGWSKVIRKKIDQFWGMMCASMAGRKVLLASDSDKS